MIRFPILALALAACAHAPSARQHQPDDCRTRCGLTAPKAVDCERLQSAETASVEALGWDVAAWSPTLVCRAIRGWDVTTVTHDLDGPCSFTRGWLERGMCVAGFTRVESRTVAVLGPPLDPSILVHELAHVVDVETIGRGGHCDWRRRGISRAIEEISREEDTSAAMDSNCKLVSDGGYE